MFLFTHQIVFKIEKWLNYRLIAIIILILRKVQKLYENFEEGNYVSNSQCKKIRKNTKMLK